MGIVCASARAAGPPGPAWASAAAGTATATDATIAAYLSARAGRDGRVPKFMAPLFGQASLRYHEQPTTAERKPEYAGCGLYHHAKRENHRKSTIIIRNISILKTGLGQLVTSAVVKRAQANVPASTRYTANESRPLSRVPLSMGTRSRASNIGHQCVGR